MTSTEDAPQPSSFIPATGCPRPPLTLLCDFDGPLVDVSGRYYQTYQLALADTLRINQAQGVALPIQVLTKEQFWQMKQNRVADAEIALRSGLRSQQIEVFLGRVRHWVNQPSLLQQDQLQPGVRWALALLHARGVSLAVVTLRCQRQARQILEQYGLAHLFTSIRGTHDALAAYCNYTELKTQLVSEALAEHTLLQSRTWLVGDTEADVLAGQAAGISTIAVTCGIRSAAYLKALQPTRLHHDLLSVAHYLAGLAQLVQA